MSALDLSVETRELARLEREVVRSLVEGHLDQIPDLVSQFRDQRLALAQAIADAPAVSTSDPEARAVLNRLSHGPPFTAEKILASLTVDGDEQPLLDPSDSELGDIGSDLLYSWISHYEYARNLFRLNAVIVGVVLPDPLLAYLREARTCFAFEQYNAVIALSRTILESAARDLCERLGVLEQSVGNVARIDSYRFHQLIRATSSGELYERATRAYYKACPVIHGSRTVESETALCVLREVLHVVQLLYQRHGY